MGIIRDPPVNPALILISKFFKELLQRQKLRPHTLGTVQLSGLGHHSLYYVTIILKENRIRVRWNEKEGKKGREFADL